MALHVWRDLCLAFFCTLFFLQIIQYESLTSWPVNSCPANQSAVEAATLRLNCSDVRESFNVYHCLPLSNLSGLVEFCYDGTSGLVEAGNCMVLYRDTLNNYPCGHFNNGCPNKYYLPKNMYNYAACLAINPQNSCYIADRSCPNKSFLETTSLSSVTAMENKTQNVEATTATDNKNLQVERMQLTMAISLGVLIPPFTIVFFVWRCKPKRKDPLEDQEMSAVYRENADNVLPAIYQKKGSSIRFNNLRLEIINGISEDKMESLKASLKVVAELSDQKKKILEDIETVKDFISFTIDYGIFKERDVIMMQYLLRSIGRSDLELTCIEYARKDKQALCFFESRNLPGDGHEHVQIHVPANMKTYRNLDDVIATVAAIVGCDKSCIELVGVLPAESFIIVISMKEEFERALLQKDPHELGKLTKYNVDWIKIENKTISIPKDTSVTMDETTSLIAESPMNEDNHHESDEEDAMNEMLTYYEDKEYSEGNQKYLEAEVIPISRSIIAEEQGVVADDDSSLKTFIRINAADLKPNNAVDISDVYKNWDKLGQKNFDRKSEKVYMIEEDNS